MRNGWLFLAMELKCWDEKRVFQVLQTALKRKKQSTGRHSSILSVKCSGKSDHIVSLRIVRGPIFRSRGYYPKFLQQCQASRSLLASLQFRQSDGKGWTEKYFLNQ
ncbi:hypothetical protein SUGI_1076340 [Cryptomeria japonica]|nr:hypothetical protein SUGI_1076340 [Cryptomeria japonica]